MSRTRGTLRSITRCSVSSAAAIAGKAACLGIHPYKVDTASLGVKYRQVQAYTGEMVQVLQAYRAKWMQQVSGK